MVANLLCCPFCGGKPEFQESNPYDQSDDVAFTVFCRACGTEHPWRDTPEDAVSFWNRRALASHTSALAEKDEEIARLRADRSDLLGFVGKAQAVSVGLVVSGHDHPNPNSALIGIFDDGREVIEKIAARAALTDQQKG